MATETWSINVRGNAASELDKIEKSLRATQKEMGGAAEKADRLRMEMDEVTDAFKVFGARGNAMAAALEDIPDPIERNRRALQLWRREMAGSGDPVSRFEGKLGSLKAEFAAIPAPVKAAGAAIAAMGGVLAKVTVDAVKAYIETNEEARRGSERLTKAVDRLQKAYGEMVYTTSDVDDSMSALTDTVNGFASIFEELTEVSESGGFLGFLANWATNLIKGPLTALETFGDALSLIRDGLIEIGAIEDTAAKERSKRRKDFEREAEQQRKDLEGQLRLREEMLRVEQEYVEAQQRKDLDKMREADLERIRLQAQEEEHLAKMREQATSAGGGGGGSMSDAARKAREEARFWEQQAAKEDEAIYEGFAERDDARREAAAARKLEAMELAAAQDDLRRSIERMHEAMAETPRVAQSASDALYSVFGEAIVGELTDSIAQLDGVWQGFLADILTGEDAFSSLQDGLLSILQQLITQVVPILNALATSLVGVQTGNAALIFTGAALLGVLGAALSNLGGGSGGGRGSGGRSAEASARNLFREFGANDRQRGGQETTIVVNLGTRKYFETIREGERRGLLGGGNAV